MKKSILIFILLISTSILVVIYSPINFWFSEKIWAHRIDSKELLNDVEDKFSGLELDVVFIDSLNRFDVNHPPAKSINLSLHDYFSASKNKAKLGYWLDFKNLNKSNQEQALQKLLQICDDLKLNKEHIIVESEKVELLQKFAEKSFKTSYYLHWPGLYTLNKEQLDNKISEIRSNLARISFTPFLSSDYNDYEILSIEFPKQRKLLWCTDLKNNAKQKWNIYRILKDDQVKVLLIKSESKIEER
tara:strand:- start:4431 stop:5165 length:735 start_codon:yes stop_codon:yes gene_type:complete